MTPAQFRALSNREYLKALRNPQSRDRHDADRLLSYGGEHATQGARLHAALDHVNKVWAEHLAEVARASAKVPYDRMTWTDREDGSASVAA